MASKNNPTSAKDLILKHSTARVISASQKSFLVPDASALGFRPSRQMNDHDAKLAQAQKYR